MYVCIQGLVCMNMNTVESAHVYTDMYVQHNILSHVRQRQYSQSTLWIKQGVVWCGGDVLTAVFD